jgi:hypothetical protein
VCQARVLQQATEGIQTKRALSDMLMAVYPGACSGLGVVQVDDLETTQADDPIELR